ncbi:MAG: amino acid transporter [Candidatus Marinimicrobia bacterium]|nr:amino acid transporter [Candidatus Neomarinimicrobiota bacterium]|tara:strand:- start:455 stop:1084 length:630 start_codon:yes stop_codon:yes gene_type:complete
MLENFLPFLNEFLSVLTITILAVISPGADFVVVIKNSLSSSRQSGIFTAIGISSATWIHTFYTLTGISLIISQSIYIFTFLKIIGSVYLIYLGISSIRNQQRLNIISFNKIGLSNWESFKSGFITNMLNFKATMFYLSVFTQIVNIETPVFIQIIYGLIISIICLIWFSIIAIFLNNEKVKLQFLKVQKPIEIILGFILIGFGLKMSLK